MNRPAGTKFRKFNKTWEILSNNNGLYCTCICKDNFDYEFKDFTESDLEGVEFFV